MPKKLYLIDGSGFIFRAYHSLPPLTRADGTPTGAVYGFVNMIMKLVEGAQADYMAVIFDAGRQTFRNRIYPQYKANRPPAPEDLIPQFPLVREATEAMNIPAIELADYEADDIIATYTRQAREKGLEVVIVSSDKDLMQLICEGVSMMDAMKNRAIGAAEVLEKFGVPPQKVHDVLTLIGDTSDNVPGVPGIGPKTAAELILQYGDFEGVLANAAQIKQPKRREALLQNADQARISHSLIALKNDVVLPHTIDDLILREPDAAKLLAFAQTMGFKSLVGRLEAKHGLKAPVVKEEAIPAGAVYEMVTDLATLDRWIAAAKAKGYVAFDTETTSLDAMRAELVGFSLCMEPGKACYVPLNHVTAEVAAAPQGNLFGGEAAHAAAQAKTFTRLANQIDPVLALQRLIPLLSDPSILKIGHNIKYDMLVLKKYGAEVTPQDDTMLLSSLLFSGIHNHNMDDLAEKHLGIKTITYDEVTGTGKGRISFAEVTLEKALAYAAEDADVTLRLWQKLKPQVISQKLLTLYETVERPLVSVIVAMEERGVKVDRAQLGALSQDFSQRIEVLGKKICEVAGCEFNIGSPKQLGEILFDKMQLGGGKKGKTGSYATGADVLEDLAEAGHEIAQLILDWRQLSKLKNTYTETLGEEINPATGRVHTSYAMAATTTGRLSSNSPNLQNIPIRTEEGRKIRTAFVAEQGNRLISADYSQIELRLLAHIADIPTLKQAFRDGSDIHAITASQMFGVPLAEVTGDLRRKAKTINFGIIYGISAHGLATRLGIGRTEAANYIDSYFKQYPGIKDYMESAKQQARDHGYVTTLFGRKCHFPGINDKNPSMRSFSERAAINAPLQGTAADIIKRAMIAVEQNLQGTSSKMLLQVHDELVVETPEADAEKTSQIVRHAMENAAHLSIPLTVSTHFGHNWNEAH
ncbi:MAG TPA: DNA polymerase I [Rickettsiales bacterium]|nr:DNA polymerase I [Rickettsiales bacterium]